MTNAAPPAPTVPPEAVRTHEFTTKSGADTIEVGRKLARLLTPPQLLILRGDLGTGKTTLVKGIAQALDAAEADEVTSPTFTLIHEYDGTQGGKVEIYLENGKLFGKVTEVRPGRTPHDLCDKCPGEASKQPILGMVILRNFHPEGDDWVEGTVLDPENGKEYKGKIWSAGKDQLHMRGFIGVSLFGRTATWTRIP